jgi:tRNA A-37 threonylcarbamoyl transferase component Bud32
MENYLANPNTYYVKQNVNHREYFMQKYVYNLNIVNVPEIIEYNDETKTMVMYNMGNHNLSDYYGENATDVPDKLFNQVVKIVRNLVLHNIEYPDLTGYNFIEDCNGKVGIIDFEHSCLMTSNQVNNIHIQNICNGYKKWNPDFR